MLVSEYIPFQIQELENIPHGKYRKIYYNNKFLSFGEETEILFSKSTDVKIDTKETAISYKLKNIKEKYTQSEYLIPFIVMSCNNYIINKDNFSYPMVYTNIKKTSESLSLTRIKADNYPYNIEKQDRSDMIMTVNIKNNKEIDFIELQTPMNLQGTRKNVKIYPENNSTNLQPGDLKLPSNFMPWFINFVMCNRYIFIRQFLKDLEENKISLSFSNNDEYISFTMELGMNIDFKPYIDKINENQIQKEKRIKQRDFFFSYGALVTQKELDLLYQDITKVQQQAVFKSCFNGDDDFILKLINNNI